MRPTHRLLTGLALAAVALPLASAEAQVRSGGGVYRRQPRAANPAPQGQNFGQHHGQPNGYPPGSYVQVLPPEPLGPMSLGLLERDFQYMRSTSSNPDQFMFGRWNPRYQVVTPPQYYGGTGGYYYGGGGYYPPGGYVYGGINTPYFYGGFGFPTQQNVIQRETIIIREGNGNAPAAPGPAPERRAPDDFYLKNRAERPEAAQAETISDALDDIRKAWLNGDWDRLRSRFADEGKVRVFPKGEYRYSVDAREFTSMLRDAMKRIDTVSFELDRPKSDEAGKAFVTGKHVFLDADKEKQETYVSYTLERVSGRWRITEAGSSSTPIAKHVVPAAE